MKGMEQSREYYSCLAKILYKPKGSRKFSAGIFTSFFQKNPTDLRSYVQLPESKHKGFKILVPCCQK